MTELTQASNHVATRAARIAKLVASVERHLLEEQLEAISALPESESAPRSSEHRSATSTPETDPDAYSGSVAYSDRTPVLAARMGFYRKRQRMLTDVLGGLNRKLDAAERVMTAILAVKPDVAAVDEPVCPGWNVELQARLGGCGKITESYRRNDGTTGLRKLCAGCRKAEQRAAAEEGAAA